MSVLDIDELFNNDDKIKEQAVKDFILNNYRIFASNGETRLSFETIDGQLYVNCKAYLELKSEAQSLTNGMFKWGTVNALSISDSDIQDISGAPKFVDESFILRRTKVQSLKGFPKKCRHFMMAYCYDIFTLEGMENSDCGTLELINGSVTNLTGCPSNISNLIITDCERLENIEDASGNINEIRIANCDNLKSLKSKVKRCNLFICNLCPRLTTLQDFNTTCEIFTSNRCKNLTADEYMDEVAGRCGDFKVNLTRKKASINYMNRKGGKADNFNISTVATMRRNNMYAYKNKKR